VATSALSSSRNKLIFAACWLLWSLIHLDMLRGWGLDWQPVIIDTLASNVLLAAACLLIINNLHYYRPSKIRYWYVAAWCLALSGLWSGAVRFGLGALLRNDAEYFSFLEKSMAIRFDMALLITGCAAMLSILWYNLEEQHEKETRKADAEKLAKDAELFKLRQQMQPHFLFNSLNSINALVISQPQQARKMIQQLSDFLRGTLKKEEHQFISLNEEIQYLQLYLEIEKVRFGHRLSTEIKTDDAALSCKLPSMLLQPVMENAIKFGLYDTTDVTSISLYAEASAGNLVITIKNPFDPETASPRQGTGFGLNAVQRRLYLLYARTDLLAAQQEGNIFITVLKIPQA
jgi:two-component system, LytTR family, sensor kinase